VLPISWYYRHMSLVFTASFIKIDEYGILLCITSHLDAFGNVKVKPAKTGGKLQMEAICSFGT
jgi:hypothetical protein